MESTDLNNNEAHLSDTHKKSIKEIQELLDETQEGIFALDDEGVILYINESIKKLFQKEEKEVIGKRYNEIITTDENVIKALEDSHMQTLKMLADARASEKEKDNKLKETQKNLIDLLITFVKLIESYDPYLTGHSVHVARYAMMLAKKVGLPEEQVQELAYAGLFHDLGMLMVPRNIIQKAASLTIKEYVEVKKHPDFSVQYIKNIELFKNIIPAIRHHHERWDGEGYPSKLKHDKIPVGAQILFIAEAFDAITSKRPYRRMKTRSEAIEILKENKGTQFAPIPLDNFLFLLNNKVI